MSRHWIVKKEKNDRGALLYLWRRLFARLVDFLLWLALCYWLEEKFFLQSSSHSLARFGIDQLVACSLMVLTEPLFLSSLSTSPGKALAGLRVVSSSGKRLTLKQAYDRAWLIWRHVLGFGLPFFRVVKLFRAYTAKRHGFFFDWEKKTFFRPLLAGAKGVYGRE